MSFAKVYSAQTSFLKAHIITIEADLSGGLHSFTIVGLPTKAVDESKDRISAAIKNSGFKSPKNKNQKVVMSLAPADLKKEGPFFDLAMALAYLLASGDIAFKSAKKIFLGELSLDGDIRSVPGILPLVLEARRKGFEEVYVPAENALEAALIDGITIFAAHTLQEVIEHLNTKRDKYTEQRTMSPQEKTALPMRKIKEGIGFGDIKGQESAKRGLEIAAAGGHNVAMYGPPGTGKTMLAKAFCGILPALSFEDVLEVTGIHSVAGVSRGELTIEAPFRSPHHTSSYVSLVGGGANIRPGEVTLAHKGVLFLDEFPEFEARVIESLREPLEERVVSISRAKGSASFPAHFILIAAMNPCPCGNFGVKGPACICAPQHIARYRRKISGPIIDRIDIWLEVSRIEHSDLSDTRKYGEGSEKIAERVAKARNLQEGRFKNLGLSIKTNSEMNVRDLVRFAVLSDEVKKILNDSAKKMDLSPRAYHRVVKLARTIADLEGKEDIERLHILEALQYRPKRMESVY